MICCLQQMLVTLSSLCLLYLTAAFDAVDHELFLLRLERQFSLRGTVYGASVVSIVSVRQNVPGYIQQLYVVHCIHRVLSSARVTVLGSAVVRCVHRATSASVFSAFTGCGVCSHTRPCIVASSIDCCNAVLACAPKATTDKLQLDSVSISEPLQNRQHAQNP